MTSTSPTLADAEPCIASRRRRTTRYSIDDRGVATASRQPVGELDERGSGGGEAPLAEVRGHGRHKVLFGTNYPMIAPAKALDGFDAIGLDEEAQGLFLAGNALRIFKL